MAKKIIFIITIVAVIGVLAFGIVNTVHARRGGGQLSDIERQGLLHMREEEKLARDVYIYLYSLYGLDIFNNISYSEQHHMDAVLNLLNYYGIPDPASTQLGVFTNPDLQALYDSLIPWGSQSLSDALRVGGTIEEVDILDLEYYVAHTNKYNIQQVYGMLINGSEHHLRAFVANLSDRFGEVYVPLYLSNERYQEIISGGSGGGGGGGGGGGCGGSCGRP